MNEIELFFYGASDRLNSAILKKLNVFNFRPTEANLNGWYVLEKKFGVSALKAVTDDYSDNTTSADWIIYRYLSKIEIETIRQNKQNKKIYILLHNFVDLQYWYDCFLNHNINQYTLIVDRFNSDFKNNHDVQVLVRTKNIFYLAKPKVIVKKNKNSTVGGPEQLSVLFYAMVKILLNPIQELNHYLILVRSSQARVLGRLIELILFLHFIIKWVFIRVFYSGFKAIGLSKVFSIKFSYLFRHLIIMSCVKVYGLIYDLFSSLYRLFRLRLLTPVYYRFGGFILKYILVPLYNFIKYSINHAIVMVAIKIYYQLYSFFKTFIGFFIKWLFVPLYNFFKYSISHAIVMTAIKIYYQLYSYFKTLIGFFIKWLFVPTNNAVRFHLKHFLIMSTAKTYGFFYDSMMFVDRCVYLPIINFFKFTIKHYLLMFIYKTYGFAIDLSLITYKCVKLYLLYPVFKIYWFASFQYKKRLKKYFV